MALTFVKKSKLSTKRLRLQEKEKSVSGVEDTDDKIIRLYLERLPLLVNNIREVGLPAPGEQIRMVTKRAFNSIALLDLIMEHDRIVETYICVYSIDYASGQILDRLASGGKLGRMTFLISNLRNGAHRQKEKAVNDLFIKNPNIRLVFAGSHAKIVCAKTAGGGHFVCETSANFANNSRIEQYMLENCERTYTFHKSWIDEIHKITTAKGLKINDFDGTKQNT